MDKESISIESPAAGRDDTSRSAALGWTGRRPQAVFLSFYGAVAALFPFLPLFYADLGLSLRQIGLLAAIPPLALLVGAPSWGALADSTGKHRELLRLALVGSLASALVLSAATGFPWTLLVVTVFALFSTPLAPLLDRYAVDLLGPRKREYGRLRLWGAVGWGVVAPVAGWLVGRGGMRWAFAGYMSLLSVCLAVAWNLPRPAPSGGPRFGRSLQALLGNRQWPLFLAVAAIGGTCMATISSFLFLFLAELQAGPALMGLSMSFATLSELPVMFYAGWLLARWSAWRLTLIALGLFGVRGLLLGAMHAPWQVLPLQLMHGLTFSLLWVAGVNLASDLAPREMSATAQGLFSGTFLGIGGMVGALIGGLLYDALGAQAMFQGVALAALVASLLLLAYKR